MTPRPPRPTTAHQTTPSRLGSPPPGQTRPPRLSTPWGGTPPRLPWPPATLPLHTTRHAPPAPSRLAVAGAPPPPTTRAPYPVRHAPPAVALATRDRVARPGVGCGAGPGQARQRPPPARGTGTPPAHQASPALRHWPAPAWEDGGPVPAGAGRAASHVPPWACSGRGRETLCAGGSVHAMAEHRPASGRAPTRGETPSQVAQGLLAWGMSFWFFFPAPLAPNAGAHLLPEAGARHEQRL